MTKLRCIWTKVHLNLLVFEIYSHGLFNLLYVFVHLLLEFLILNVFFLLSPFFLRLYHFQLLVYLICYMITKALLDAGSTHDHRWVQLLDEALRYLKVYELSLELLGQ